LQLGQPTADAIKGLLDSVVNDIKTIHDLRDTATAHNDLENSTMEFQSEHLIVVNRLFGISRAIIGLIGSQLKTEFKIGFGLGYFNSLQELVKQTEHLDNGQTFFN
jgi:hypothetical protein